MLSDKRSDVRIYCKGLCGKYMILPVQAAAMILMASGDLQEGADGWTCEPCRNWFKRMDYSWHPKLLKGEE